MSNIDPRFRQATQPLKGPLPVSRPVQPEEAPVALPPAGPDTHNTPDAAPKMRQFSRSPGASTSPETPGLQVNKEQLQAVLQRQLQQLPIQSARFQDGISELQGLAGKVGTGSLLALGRGENQSLSQANLNNLLQRLSQGDTQVLDQLLERSPAEFGVQEMQFLLDLAAQKGPGADGALSLLGSIAANDLGAQTKFMQLAAHAHGRPELLKPLFQAAENQLTLFNKLLDTPQLSLSEVITVTGNYLDHPNSEARDISMAFLNSVIANRNDRAGMDTASLTVLDKLVLQKGDKRGHELMQTALSHLRDDPSAKQLEAIRRCVGRQTETGLSAKERIQALGVITAAVKKGVPGSDRIFLQAMQSDDTALYAYQTLARADREVARMLVPLVKNLPSSEDIMSPRAQLARKLGPRVTGSDVFKVEKAYNQIFQKKLERVFHQDESKLDPADKKLKQLSKLLFALQILQKPSGDVDPQDYDRERLEKDLETLFRDPDIKAVMQDTRQEAIEQVFGEDMGIQKPLDVRNYLLGNDFKDYLELLPPQKREQAITLEIQKLAGMDSHLAVEVAQELSLRQLGDEAVDRLTQTTSDRAIESLKTVLEQDSKVLAGMPKLDRSANALLLSQHLYAAIKLAKTNNISVPAALEKLGKGLSSGKKALFGRLLGQGATGVKRLLGLASAVSVAMSLTAFKGDVQSILGLCSNSASLLSKAQNLGKYTSFFKKLGVAGSAFGALSQIVRLNKAIEQGDVENIVSAGVQATGGILSTAGGALLLATPESSAFPPLAAGMLLVGGVLSIGGALYDAIFGDSPQKDFLQELGYEK